MRELLEEIAICSTCKKYLSHDTNPVLQASVDSRIAIIGQAPGQRVHQSGIPWDDQSGKELRRWLNVTPE